MKKVSQVVATIAWALLLFELFAFALGLASPDLNSILAIFVQAVVGIFAGAASRAN